MFNMNIKPRLAHVESGAIVECKQTRLKGFVVEDNKGSYQVVIYYHDGSMILRTPVYTNTNDFFTNYKMIAQSNEYEARLEGVTNARLY